MVIIEPMNKKNECLKLKKNNMQMAKLSLILNRVKKVLELETKIEKKILH